MPSFEARASLAGDRTVVALFGECDLTTRAEMAAVLAEAVAGSPVVVVDLAGLAFIDSSGIHELVTAYHAAREQGRELYLRSASGIVATVLQVTGVGELLRLTGAEDRAKDPSR